MQTWLFDIDGTLITSGGAGQVAMTAAMAACFGGEPDTSSVAFAGRTDRGILSDLFRHHGVEETATNIEAVCGEYLRLLGGCLESKGGNVLPGVASLLETLASHTGIHLGLLTGNLQGGAQRKLKHFDLWHFFNFGGFGDQHLDRDDVARAALVAAEQHAQGPIDPSQVWVVGDTPRDIGCARAIGANVVAVATGSYAVQQLSDTQPDVLLEDLSDMGPLERLLPSELPNSNSD